MEREAILKLLQSVQDGSLKAENAMDELQNISFGDLGFAKVDHNRALRTGYPEIIFCQNKAIEHIVAIVRAQIEQEETVFGTRTSDEALNAIEREFPQAEINRIGRCFWLKSKHWKAKTKVKGTIVIASAGTADAPVVEEARCTAEILGHPVKALLDVGVAGIHRLFAHREELQEAAVVVVVAGMEGALPSVVTGFVRCPVIAVPTSVGYGAHLNGMVALFAMLNSCASGLSVVNIDNGFGAAFAAARINAL